MEFEEFDRLFRVKEMEEIAKRNHVLDDYDISIKLVYNYVNRSDLTKEEIEIYSQVYALGQLFQGNLSHAKAARSMGLDLEQGL